MTEKKSFVTEFREFILRGNVVDLAVGVVMALAFKAVIDALIKDLITPIIGIPGKKDFSALTFTVHGSIFRYGDFINNVISFVLIGFVVFVAVVKPVGALMERRRRKLATAEEPAELSSEAVLLTEIRDLLRSRAS
ncbi:MAG: large-conductance mechanosensitive channel protein MscL [Acidimicrobiales bacterium]